MIKQFMLVGLGGGVGAMMRYGSNLLFKSQFVFVSTLLVNVVGSFILGALLAYGLSRNEEPANWMLFLGTGLCGGFTTFSAFSVENMILMQEGKYTTALAYILISVILGILAAFAGYKLFSPTT